MIRAPVGSTAIRDGQTIRRPEVISDTEGIARPAASSRVRSTRRSRAGSAIIRLLGSKPPEGTGTGPSFTPASQTRKTPGPPPTRPVG